MIDYINEQRVQDLSLKDDMVPLYQKIIKVQEESGELAQAFLKFDKSLNTSASAKGSAEAVLEEALDVMNVVMDIVNSMTLNNPELEAYVRATFEAKLDKWESKQAKYATKESGESIEDESIIDKVIDKVCTFFNKVNTYFNVTK